MASKPKAAKKVKPTKDSKPVRVVNHPQAVEMTSFEVLVVIPTQSYGNIQPKITVKAARLQDALDVVMPEIEKLYAKYAETKPAFLGKIEVVEKVVTPAPKKEESAAPSSVAPSAPSSSTSTALTTPETQKPEPVLKAEKAISLAVDEAAMIVIQGQIEKSSKIPPEFKDALLTLCLKKRSSFK